MVAVGAMAMSSEFLNVLHDIFLQIVPSCLVARCDPGTVELKLTTGGACICERWM